MNYYVHNLETVNARICKKKHFQFDYIEPDPFEKMQNSSDLSVIGCMKLKEIEKETATDTVVISSGIIDHYFCLCHPTKWNTLTGNIWSAMLWYQRIPMLLSMSIVYWCHFYFLLHFWQYSVPLYFKSRGNPSFLMNIQIEFKKAEIFPAQISQHFLFD